MKPDWVVQRKISKVKQHSFPVRLLVWPDSINQCLYFQFQVYKWLTSVKMQELQLWRKVVEVEEVMVRIPEYINWTPFILLIHMYQSWCVTCCWLFFSSETIAFSAALMNYNTIDYDGVLLFEEVFTNEGNGWCHFSIDTVFGTTNSCSSKCTLKTIFLIFALGTL